MVSDEPAARLSPGLKASVELTVSEQDTAVAVGSGDVPVLASPRVLALAEEAAVGAVAGHLPDGWTSVGTWAELEHRRPTPVDGRVRAEATLIGVHGRRLEVAVAVTDGDDVEVARVRHHRALVDRERFVGALDDA